MGLLKFNIRVKTMKNKIVKLEQCYQSEGLYLPENLEFELQPDAKKILDHIINLIGDGDIIKSIDVVTHKIFVDTPSHYDDFRVGSESVAVFKGGSFYYNMSSKWDCALSAEYSFNVAGF